MVSISAQNLTEAQINDFVSKRSTGDKIYTVDEIVYNDAIYEGKGKVSKVTESAAYMVKEETTIGLEESAEGYVTVMDGNNDVYHYTRAEIYRNNMSYAKSSNIYGYGRVYAKTNYFPVNKNINSKAKIFYGGF